MDERGPAIQQYMQSVSVKGIKHTNIYFGRGGIKGNLFSDFSIVSTYYSHMLRGNRSATPACGLFWAEGDQEPADSGKVSYLPYLPDEFSFLLPERTVYLRLTAEQTTALLTSVNSCLPFEAPGPYFFP